MAAVLAGSMLLRVPSFFEPHWYGDEGVFAAVAHQLLAGEQLYQEVWDHKPPLIYVLYAVVVACFGDSIVALRGAATLAVLITQVCLFAFVRPTQGTARALVAAAIYGVLMAYPAIEGQLALTEVFMVALIAPAMLWLSRSGKGDLATTKWVSIGLLLGFATAFKPVGFLEVAAVMLYILACLDNARHRGALVVAGVGLPWLVVLLAFTLTDGLPAFLDANVGFQFRYVGASQRADAWPYLLAAAVVLPVLFVLARGERYYSLVVLWLGFAVAGALVGGLQYPHYLIQALPPLAVAIASLRVPEAIGTRAIAGAAVALTVVLAVRESTTLFTEETREYARTYYQQFAESARTGTREPFNQVFGSGWSVTDGMVLALGNADAHGSHGLVWTNRAWVYPLADLRPITPFLAEHHVRGRPDIHDDIARALLERPAMFVVIERGRHVPRAIQDVLDARFTCSAEAAFSLCRLTGTR